MLITQRWERTFSAMGTDCHVVVVGGSRALTARAVDSVARLQQLWTRFDPDSEVMRLNLAGSGTVGPDTWALLTRGIVGRQWTAGRFDPFMVRQIVSAGYDRDYDELRDQDCSAPVPAPEPVPAVAQPVRELDRRRRYVRFAPGAQLDSGGIGKGLAADLVSEELMRHGAAACLVNLGGDLRVRGDKGSPWEIGVDSEGPGSDLSVRLAAGGLATSSSSRRVWLTAAGSAHHLLDPRTGRPLRSPWSGATTIAPQAWVAEALSKAVLLTELSVARRLMRRHQGGGLVQDGSGGVERL